MKKFLTVALVLAFAFAAVNAYACGEKNDAAKAETSKAKAEMTSSANGTCHSEAKAQSADAGSYAPDAKAMTTEVKKTDGASSCPYMKDADAKVQKADVKTEKAGSDCCAGKTTKSSNASQKAEAKPETKKTDNPVLIMSAPTGSTTNQ